MSLKRILTPGRSIIAKTAGAGWVLVRGMTARLPAPLRQATLPVGLVAVHPGPPFLHTRGNGRRACVGDAARSETAGLEIAPTDPRIRRDTSEHHRSANRVASARP